MNRLLAMPEDWDGRGSGPIDVEVVRNAVPVIEPPREDDPAHCLVLYPLGVDSPNSSYCVTLYSKPPTFATVQGRPLRIPRTPSRLRPDGHGRQVVTLSRVRPWTWS